MKPIGGFLDLELVRGRNRTYHDAVALSTGRSCFFSILRHLRPVHLHLPYYLCDSLLAPLFELNIPYSFYSIDHSLEIKGPLPRAKKNEAVLYVNYFGLKSGCVVELGRKYRDRLIVDDTQAFFEKGHPGSWSFNSARKFLGVPDGAYLYSPRKLKLSVLGTANPDYRHLINRMIGNNGLAYRQFLAHEASLGHQVEAMSALTSCMLGKIDYEEVATRRQRNFDTLHNALRQRNLLHCMREEGQVPLYYPFLIGRPLRREMIKSGIFVPQLWSEVLTRLADGFDWEKQLARNLLLLPIDQRYGTREMARIAERLRRAI